MPAMDIGRTIPYPGYTIPSPSNLHGVGKLVLHVAPGDDDVSADHAILDLLHAVPTEVNVDPACAIARQ